MAESKKIKVLVVDDSRFMQKLISQVLSSDSDIEVIDTAMDGNEAIEKTQILHPDVITMDVKMPRLDGISALEKIMSFCPTPTIMVSSYTKESAKETISALNAGAIDFITKPSQTGIALDLDEISEELIKKVKTASHIRTIRTAHRILPEKSQVVKKVTSESTWHGKQVDGISAISHGSIVVIASSTGGPKALNQIIPNLPQNFGGAIIIIQHMPFKFTSELAAQLNSISSITVKEGENGEKILPGIAYVAPGDYHLYVTSNGRLVLLQTSKIYGHRPCADITMKSVAEVYNKSCIGVVLTGMGSDGTEGIKSIHEYGGKIVVQDEASSLLFGMPKEAISTGLANWVLPLDKISDLLIKLIGVKKDD